MADDLSRREQRLFADITEILQSARAKAYRAVNTVMVETYWQMGRRIVEEEQRGKERAGYGEALIVNLSRYLSETFGKGFSIANLWNFRQFYLTFPAFGQFSTHRVGNLAWSHIRLIMRLDSEPERRYYLEEASAQNWSVRLLERNIQSGYYRRLLSSQSGRSNALSVAPITPDSSGFIKDPYVLEFLGVPEDLTGKETVLEQALINDLQKFLLELGKGFSFVARQMRISTETSHFYVDLVFYNYLLKCFVVIDLKTAKLTHQDIGQMDMYVRMFDELKRGPDDNPTLGILLCADKDETVVKYSVLRESQQLFASKYQTVLPTEEELAAMLERENLAGRGMSGEWRESTSGKEISLDTQLEAQFAEGAELEARIKANLASLGFAE
ncbi:MAG: PDDEXK nuclease domain-containing protein [Azoarcus sp.]|jgi:predicted nuclease of restriction endonuclease-like (RecB) superfamily|nr:PDDEXK nuclease domain-containing protein [Azoarcus sp.]